LMGCAASRGKGVTCVKGACVCGKSTCSSDKKNGVCKKKALLEQEHARVHAAEPEQVELVSVETPEGEETEGHDDHDDHDMALEQEDVTSDCLKCDIGTGCKLTWLTTNPYRKCPPNAAYYSLSKDQCSNSPTCTAPTGPSGPSNHGPSPAPYKPSPSPARPGHSTGYSPAPSPFVCATATGGSCKLMGCAASRGKGVTCVKGACVCGKSTCSSDKKNGVCKKKALLEQEHAELQARPALMWERTTWQDVLEEEGLIEANASTAYPAVANANQDCEDDTFGSCSVFSCSESRGPTECKSHKCKCAPGHCAKNGACFAKKNNCVLETAGTCSLLSCASSRGDSKCKSGKCMCQLGNCAWKGKCYPDTDTGGSCSVFGCSSSRGPTVCHKGSCLCQAGYVAVQGRCERAPFV